MKQTRKICRRVLASMMLIAVSLSCAFNGSAQITYRGFVEGGLGASIVSGAYIDGGFIDSDEGGVAFSYMLATTHGIQLKNNFFGIGFGITPRFCAVGEEYGPSKTGRISKLALPAYLNWRYDFFSSGASFKPFVGVKAGFFIPITQFDVFDMGELNENGDECVPYFAIDIGLRKRLSDSSGLSIGLCIQNSNNNRVEYGKYVDNRVDLNTHSVGISILAKIAFDF